MGTNQAGQSVSPYFGETLKLSEHELEKIQLFLETVHKTLHIPLVLEESNVEYPIVSAENHYGISAEAQENLINFIEKKYQLGKSKIKLKILMSSTHQNLVHIGLPRSFITQLSITAN
jgi:hypothetical protein